MKFDKLYEKYSAIESGEWSRHQKEEIQSVLSSTNINEIDTAMQAKKFIELLKVFREEAREGIKFNGEGARALYDSLLKVGENGIYSNELRFIYELIQNVDDCDYLEIESCKLDIQFDINNECIILTYNEEGFKPANVFAITGIADGIKNLSDEKVEIGEKGIGFKSVFGIARSVLIQSGNFSFEIFEDEFTVPCPRYDDFEPITGTRMVLSVDAKKVHDLYREIVKWYDEPELLFNRNPILFLNKLSKVRFFIDNSFRYLEFQVSRTSPDYIGNLEFEKDVTLSVSINDSYDSPKTKTIHCYRYSKFIEYDSEICKSRYGENSLIGSRKHKLVAIFPHEVDLNSIFTEDLEGAFYSFLPTQIKMSVPVAIHAPYKLGSSREYVDSQRMNLWFNYTTQCLSEFLTNVYANLARNVMGEIIRYIPRREDYCFLINDNTKCLKTDYFRGSILREQKLFYTVNKTFERAENIVHLTFENDETIERIEDVYLMLEHEKSLFVSNVKNNLSFYGIEVIKKPYEELFKKAVMNNETSANALKMLNALENFPFDRLIETMGEITIDAKQIKVISENDKITKSFHEVIFKRIKNGPAAIRISDESRILKLLDDENWNDIEDCLDDDSKRKTLGNQEITKEKSYTLEGIESGFYFIAENMILLSRDSELDAYANFYGQFYKKDLFIANLKIRQASKRLDNVDDSVSNREYLELLHDVRSSLVKAFGERVYGNYIQIINKSGLNEERFIQELLQNADDCCYEENVEPYFLINIEKNVMHVNYNEIGFSKSNVRSITAIGESTKRSMISGDNMLIGEKGVGFKSVFGIAKSVDIHSNGFNFRLTSKRPTVPTLLEPKNKTEGTQMTFELDRPIENNFFDEELVLKICMCLRKLKRLKIGEIEVEISDLEDRREILINGKKITLRKFEYDFFVDDDEAVEVRQNNQRIISKNQKICFYIPTNRLPEYNLYCGLPTETRLNIPLIIDAPFEVSTSREGVLHNNKWNTVIKDEIYSSLIKLLHELKQKMRIDVLKYVDDAIFSDDKLNEYEFLEKLSDEEIVPIFGSDLFLAPGESAGYIYPNVCLYLLKNGVQPPDEAEIIDCFKKQGYATKLEQLGGEQAPRSNVIAIIKDGLSHTKPFMGWEEFRDSLLYPYLESILDGHKLGSVVETLKIIPVRPSAGHLAEYVAFNEKNIYISDERNSTKDYYVLDDFIMSDERFQKIFNRKVLVMDASERNQIYKKNILEALEGTREQADLAEFLLQEFISNETELVRLKEDLLGRIKKIPMKYLNGEYYTGNKFINENEESFNGEIATYLVVDERFKSLARFLDCKSIHNIHYDDIDYVPEMLREDDIEDFLYQGFKYKSEILESYISDKKISEELIKKYNLDVFMSNAPMYEDDSNYEFPLKPIESMGQINKHIHLLWKKVKEVVRTEKKSNVFPQSYIDERKAYLLDMYECEAGEDKLFCQICKKPVLKKYIEAVSIELEAEHAWTQMSLCLCVKCGKDYKLARMEEELIEEFISDLRESDIVENEPATVQIANMNVSFTATHLAEVQEILRLNDSLQMA